MTTGAPDAGDVLPAKPPFRCKVLKPPRYVVDPRERTVIYPPIDVVAGVIRHTDGRFLITQRLAGDTLGGYWEFPGGKVEPGEDLRAALRRELLEEVGLETEIGAEIHRVVHPYPDRDVRLYFYEARILSGEPAKLEVADFAWVTAGQFLDYQFPEADLALLNQLRGES
jgi:8-oxo-dGTP diphosphatase